ncbi:hypothetical protein D3C87_2077970 [compost metagenome]
MSAGGLRPFSVGQGRRSGDETDDDGSVEEQAAISRPPAGHPILGERAPVLYVDVVT